LTCSFESFTVEQCDCIWYAESLVRS